MDTEGITTKPRKPRSDKGPKITDRDLDALEWIAEQYAISVDHLRYLLARLANEDDRDPKEEGRLTQKRTMYIVKRWEELGLIQKAWILHNGPAWLWLTPEGLRMASEQLGKLRYYEPTPATINHIYYCNHTRLYVEQRREDAEWTGERLLRANRPKAERGIQRPHLPDAEVWTHQSYVAVEVELTVKHPAELDKVLQSLATNGRYHTVWYFTRERSTKAIQQAINTLPEMYTKKFVVYTIDTCTLQ